MSTVVIFDEGASPQQVIGIFPSADASDYDGRTDVVIDPDLSALQGTVPCQYWKHSGGSIVAYTQAEIDAQDAAEAAATTFNLHEEAKNFLAGTDFDSILIRALADVIKDEINILRAALEDVKNAIENGSNLSNVKSAVTALPNLADRDLTQLRTAIRNRIDSGGVDT